MAAKFMENHIDIREASAIIIKTLPICKVRHIGHSTFTILVIDSNGQTRIIEHANPKFIFLRNGQNKSFTSESIKIDQMSISFTSLEFQNEDRLILFSDGVIQSGMGQPQFPLGFGQDATIKYSEELLIQDPFISARELAKKIVVKGLQNDKYSAQDDITCGVIYQRKPRKTLVLTGPPYDPEKDKEMVAMLNNFSGKKIIAGGTTASIVARELNLKVEMDILKFLQFDLPPVSKMAGFELVTEGTMTLGRVAKILEESSHLENIPQNSAGIMINILLESDLIDFIVGTRINEAHHAPTLPVELEIRRNTVKRIRKVLEEKFLKTTSVKYL
jgi:hypothetical protein